LFTTRKVVAFCVFLAMEPLALNLLWGQMAASPAKGALDAMCPSPYKAPSNPELQASYTHVFYTGIGPIDSILCGKVAFFMETMKHRGFPTVMSIVTSFTPLSAFFFIEAARNNRSPLIAFPALFGIIIKLFSGGASIPLYWVLFILSGSDRMSPTGKPRQIEQSRALTILIALIGAYVVPMYFLIDHPTIFVVILWNIFPLTMFAIEKVFNFLIPASNPPKSGKTIVQIIYLISLFACAIPHLKILLDFEQFPLADVFLPSWSGSQSQTITEMGTLFLMWDTIFTFGSSALATLWFAPDFEQLIVLSAVNIIGIPTIGPGASFALVMIWREGVLSAEPQGAKKSQ